MNTTQPTKSQPAAESRHTPGPWAAYAYAAADSQGYDIRQIDTPRPQGPIARVSRESNARLIAAAPELLEALELAQATIDRLTVDHHGFSSTRGTWDVITAAIAKAKGIK